MVPKPRRPGRWLPWVAAGALALLGSRPETTPVIGVAYGLGRPAAVDVVESVLADRHGEPPVHIITPPGPDTPITLAREVERAQLFADTPGLVAVVGHGGSRTSLMAAPIYNEARIIQVVPTGSAAALDEAGPWTFSLAPSDSIEGAFMARWVVDSLGRDPVSVFHGGHGYGISLGDAVTAALREHDVQVFGPFAFRGSDTCDASDYAATVRNALRVGRPRTAIVAGQSIETLCLVEALRDAAPRVRIVAGDGASPLYHRPHPAFADSVFLTTFWHADHGSEATFDFVRRFYRLTGRSPDQSDALIFDALMLLAQAVHEVGGDPEAVRAYLRSLAARRPPYPGVTGPIRFSRGRRSTLSMVRAGAGSPLEAR